MSQRPWLPWLTLAALVLVTSGHRFANELLYLDDIQIIEEGSVIHDPSLIGAVLTHHTTFVSASDPGGVQALDTYRPVTVFLFMWDAAISGRETPSYHFTNLALHVLCCWLVFAVGRRVIDRPGAVLYGAAVFAVHPWSIEAHVWIDGRSDPACLLFILAAALALLRAEERTPKGAALRVAAAVFFLLATLSKETAFMMLPALILLPAAAPPHALAFKQQLRSRVLPIGVAAAIGLSMRVAVLGGFQTHRDGDMLLAAARNLPILLVDSLRQTLVPSLPYLRSLREEYASADATLVVLAAIVISILCLGTGLLRRRFPAAIAVGLWFFLPLVPVAVISTVLWPGFGRYLYIPLAGAAWALAALGAAVFDRVPRPNMMRAFAALHIVALSLMAAAFTRDFHDDERLFNAAIRARPDVAMGHGWLGLSRLHYGHPNEATAPLMQAAQLDPDTHRYLIAAGRAALASGDVPTASMIAERGIWRFADLAEEAPYHLLALNTMTEPDPELAVGHLVRCLEVWPDRPDCAEALETLLEDDTHRAAFEALGSGSPLTTDR